MPKTVLFNQISKGKKEQNREIQKCLILLEEHGNVGCIRLQQENSSIELISPEGYKVKETEEVSKLREIFASQSDENKVFFLNKVELETFFESARKTKKKSGIQSQDELMEILNYMQEENEITEVCESVYTTTEITFKIRTEVSRMLSVSKVITLSQVKEVFQTSRKNARLMLEVNTMPLQTDHLDIPIWQKYTMTIEEAAAYFHIGRSRIRAIVAENPYAPYVLMVGNRVQIKLSLIHI